MAEFYHFTSTFLKCIGGLKEYMLAAFNQNCVREGFTYLIIIFFEVMLAPIPDNSKGFFVIEIKFV